MKGDAWFLVGSGVLAGLASALESWSMGVPVSSAAIPAAWTACMALGAAALVALTGRNLKAWWLRALHVILVCVVLSFAVASLAHARSFQMDVVMHTWASMAWTTTLAVLLSALLVRALLATRVSRG